jgi:hypothetical protein
MFEPLNENKDLFNSRVKTRRNQYLALYTNDAEYNTNAQSYYDALARLGAEFDTLNDLVRQSMEQQNMIWAYLQSAFNHKILTHNTSDIDLETSNIFSLTPPTSELDSQSNTVWHWSETSDNLTANLDSVFTNSLSNEFSTITNEINNLGDTINQIGSRPTVPLTTDVANHLAGQGTDEVILTRKALDGSVLASDVWDIAGAPFVQNLKQTVFSTITQINPDQNPGSVFMLAHTPQHGETMIATVHLEDGTGWTTTTTLTGVYGGSPGASVNTVRFSGVQLDDAQPAGTSVTYSVDAIVNPDNTINITQGKRFVVSTTAPTTSYMIDTAASFFRSIAYQTALN